MFGLERATKWRNPYLSRLADFPGRIFTLRGDEQEAALFREIVGAKQLRFVEIGSGSGQHIIELARRNPEAQYWGFELRFKRTVRTIEKADAAGVPNARILCMSGERLSELFPQASVAGIYVNFPDPWERPKQWKHRILSTGLLDRAALTLEPNGFLAAKTDHEAYYRAFLEELKQDSRFQLLAATEDLHRSSMNEGNIVTEFESLFTKQGLPIFALRAKFLGSGDSEKIETR